MSKNPELIQTRYFVPTANNIPGFMRWGLTHAPLAIKKRAAQSGLMQAEEVVVPSVLYNGAEKILLVLDAGKNVVSLHTHKLLDATGRIKKGIEITIISKTDPLRRASYGVMHAPLWYESEEDLEREVQTIQEISEASDINYGENIIQPRANASIQSDYRYNTLLSGLPLFTLDKALKLLNKDTSGFSESERGLMTLIILQNAMKALKSVHEAGFFHGHATPHYYNYQVNKRGFVHILDFKYAQRTAGFSSQYIIQEAERFASNIAGYIESDSPLRDLLVEAFVQRMHNIDELVQQAAKRAGVDLTNEEQLTKLYRKFHNAHIQDCLERIDSTPISLDEIEQTNQVIQMAIEQAPTIKL